MKRYLFLATLTLATTQLLATEPERKYGVESTSSEYIEQRYLHNDLVYYLDYQDLHITYQTETIGEYNQPDQMVFSVEGSSFRWNKYYIDGFRVDSRFSAGSTPYYTNMSNYDLSMDYLDSKLYFDTSSNLKQSVSLKYNVGGVGGISPTTATLQRLLHDTATDRAYKPIEDRNKVKGSATGDLNFALKHNGKEYMQSLYLNYGERNIVGFDQGGIDSYYTEDYAEVQLNGELPTTLGGLFDKTHYIMNFSHRDHLNSELYYSEEESPALNSFSASLYGTKRGDGWRYTSGFNFAINNTEHEDLNYSRNVIDHDGEAFEPWMPDGSTKEFSHSFTLDRELNDWLRLSADCYNSLIAFNPSQSSFYNTTYAQLLNDESPTMLYRYEWQSNKFYSALLENSVGLNTRRELSRKLSMQASVDLTLDAMLIKGESLVTPNFEVRVGFDYNPTKWLNLGLNLSRERVSYNFSDIQFLSDDYLSGVVYYVDDNGTKGDLFTTTGGAYHSLGSDVKQPTYYVVDIPIEATFGRHTITLLHSYRKYCNTWSVGFDGDYSDYGYIEQCETNSTNKEQCETIDLFFFDGGKEVNYVVGEYPDGAMGEGFFNSTPSYLCSNIQYTYTAPKFMVSIGWQSYMMSGLSTLGNGPLHNNLGALSESSANPNTYQVVANIDSEYRAVGRLDQDRAYIARIFTSFNITPKLSMAINAKFKDGQPFSMYQTSVKSNTSGNQIAIFPESSRGINTADGDFGSREDGIYTIDVRLKYMTQIAKRHCEFSLNCYNIYDYGNELTEYTFNQDMEFDRNSMSLTTPRGLILSFKMDL